MTPRVIEFRYTAMHFFLPIKLIKIPLYLQFIMPLLTYDYRTKNYFKNYAIFSPTTSRYPDLWIMGSVLIWHMYHPRSLSCALWMLRNHLWPEGRVREMRGFRVITLLWIVNMVWVSTRTQATWEWRYSKLILSKDHIYIHVYFSRV